MQFSWAHIITASLIATISQAAQLKEVPDSESERVPAGDKLKRDSPDDLDEAFKDDLGIRNLPILPPLILLDYSNETNSTLVDKPKRAIDRSLSYGLQSNNPSPKKYSFYFPSGKSGTTVSVEESISPFLPKTIIERLKPVTGILRRPNKEARDDEEEDDSSARNSNPYRVQNQATVSTQQSRYKGSFDQRTRLQKTSPSFRSHPGLSAVQGSHYGSQTTINPTSTIQDEKYPTTPKPRYRQDTYSSGSNYVSPTTASPLYHRLSTPPSLYVTSAPNFNPETHMSQTSRLQTDLTSKAVHPAADYYSRSLGALRDYPKYTVENGVKYEHKIVWKYPDGRVIDTPPDSYDDLPTDYQTREEVDPTTNFESLKYHRGSNFNENYNNAYQPVYPQKPVQFSEEDIGVQRETEFRSYPPFSQSAPEYNSNSPYLPYQAIHGNPDNDKDPLTIPQTPSRYSQKNLLSASTSRPVSKYAINSPDPNYIDVTPNPSKIDSSGTSISESDGQLSKNLFSKYSPELQRYLSKIFTTSKDFNKSESREKDIQPSYSDLLKYNPSISQYIKNPASILNAQPTFVQAGNSLVPVIILRIDGTPPTQPDSTPNINLKALLQQYLIQYAQRINDMNQDINSELGDEYYMRSHAFARGNPIADSTKFTQGLGQFSKDPKIFHGSHRGIARNREYGKEEYENGGYAPILKRGQKEPNAEDRIIDSINTFTSQQRRSQRVKSVEIITDP